MEALEGGHTNRKPIRNILPITAFITAVILATTTVCASSVWTVDTLDKNPMSVYEPPSVKRNHYPTSAFLGY